MHPVRISSASVEMLVRKECCVEEQSFQKQNSPLYEMMLERSCKGAREGQGPKKAKQTRRGNGAGEATRHFGAGGCSAECFYMIKSFNQEGLISRPYQIMFRLTKQNYMAA